MGIYVETRIRGSIDDLWERTQSPDLHERWDLRFSSIEYLPRPDPNQPQLFRYTTRIGFGLSIQGTGETVGEHDSVDGRRTSALKFWSSDPKSLIVAGSGYWQYIPDGDGVRFLTWYDYQTRFGAIGRFIDRVVFRPLMGWATAWSFDRLRLWIEYGLDPATTLRSSLLRGATRFGVAFALGAASWALLGRRWAWLVQSLTLVAAVSSVTWQLPEHIPAARRCLRRRPQPTAAR